MLGRKNYAQEELDRCRAEVDQQLAAYKALVTAVAGATAVTKVDSALQAFEAPFFKHDAPAATTTPDCV
jgi:hypothetical protein